MSYSKSAKIIIHPMVFKSNSAKFHFFGGQLSPMEKEKKEQEEEENHGKMSSPVPAAVTPSFYYIPSRT